MSSPRTRDEVTFDGDHRVLTFFDRNVCWNDVDATASVPLLVGISSEMRAAKVPRPRLSTDKNATMKASEERENVKVPNTGCPVQLM